MAAQTGSTFIAEIDRQRRNFKYDKFKKVLQNDRDNDPVPYQLRHSKLITVLFSVTHCQSACIYAITANAKTTVLLVCHSTGNKYADENEKHEYYCHSMSVWGIFYNQIFTLR